MVAHAGKIPTKFAEFGFIPDNCICLKFSRAFSETYFVHILRSLHYMKRYLHHASCQTISEPCVFFHILHMSIRALTTITFDEKPFSTSLWISTPSSRISMMEHAGKLLAKVRESGFTPDNYTSLSVSRDFLENPFCALECRGILLNT